MSKGTVEQSSTDYIFEQLNEEILSMKLAPHTKLSETEVANRFGVSRQPVREAFFRLGNLRLLSIQPHRPATVRGFSMEHMQDALFVRLSVELEVIRSACANWDAEKASTLECNLVLQRQAIDSNQLDAFRELDYEFHKLICDLSGYPLAFETIKRCKQHVDRLSALSLARAGEVTALLEDHEDIANALKARSARSATRLLRKHAGRLNLAIDEIFKSHYEYFE